MNKICNLDFIKFWVVYHNGTIVLVSASLVLASWFITSTIEKQLREVESKFSQIESDQLLFDRLTEMSVSIEGMKEHLHGISVNDSLFMDQMRMHIHPPRAQEEKNQQTINFLNPKTQERETITCTIDPRNDYRARVSNMRGHASRMTMWRNELDIKSEEIDRLIKQIDGMESMSILRSDLILKSKSLDKTKGALKSANQSYNDGLIEALGSYISCEVTREKYIAYTKIQREFRDNVRDLQVEFRGVADETEALIGQVKTTLENQKKSISSLVDFLYILSFVIYFLGTILAIVGKWGEEQAKEV
ncbi:hypothetical protein ALTERO38_52199 [Alteromonas sp. 38]|uniref:hypothetical protein n=1 Tax=unclassified Alteromonas TaxID=2614992 RepID=UPI0012F01852|nr:MULTISPECIES: hypothetical protein [unclassified Alteromonas]CAD5268489.1 hypothetical protein ALTER154_50028 [Alteromonas sp. 154]VXC02588.1 hypothetical protein ALTERO38_52199 [Alteromonas sp. 38]